MPEFPCTQPFTLTVRIGGGSVDVVAEDRSTALVEVEPFDDSEASRTAAAAAVVRPNGAGLFVEAPQSSGGWLLRRAARLRVTARVPTGSGVALRLASATARCHGRFAGATVVTASGNVSIEEVTEDLTAKTASGDVMVGRVGGGAAVHTASGRMELGAVGGHLTAHTASGDLDVGSLGDGVRAVSASGDVRVGELSRGAVRVKSASGNIDLGVAAGTGVWLDLSTTSGAVHSDLAMAPAPPTAGGAALSVIVRTTSGDITLSRTSASATATRTAS
jgi:DUF4097 and DUF4098 domain-containing protein YvlB